MEEQAALSEIFSEMILTCEPLLKVGKIPNAVPGIKRISFIVIHSAC